MLRIIASAGGAVAAAAYCFGQVSDLKPPLYLVEPFTLEKVRQYADAGADLLGSKSPGYFWFCRAVGEAKPDIVKFLLEKGIRPNELTWVEMPMLFFLAYNSSKNSGDRVAVADLLLGAGAEINELLNKYSPTRTPFTGNALHALAWFGDPELAKYLIARGIKKDVLDANGQTALIKAFEPLRPTLGYGWTGQVSNDLMIRTLIECGCDPQFPGIKPSKYSQYNSGVTALHIAAYLGRCDLVELMSKMKPYHDLITEAGQTPLHVAVLRRENVQMVKLLLQLGANRSVRDNNGETPLEIAMRKRFEEIETILRG